MLCALLTMHLALIAVPLFTFSYICHIRLNISTSVNNVQINEKKLNGEMNL